jgi:hypothetical protein
MMASMAPERKPLPRSSREVLKAAVRGVTDSRSGVIEATRAKEHGPLPSAPPPGLVERVAGRL